MTTKENSMYTTNGINNGKTVTQARALEEAMAMMAKAQDTIDAIAAETELRNDVHSHLLKAGENDLAAKYLACGKTKTVKRSLTEVEFPEYCNLRGCNRCCPIQARKIRRRLQELLYPGTALVQVSLALTEPRQGNAVSVLEQAAGDVITKSYP